MRQWQISRILFLVGLNILVLSGVGWSAEPASPADAAKIFDLGKIPLVSGAEKPNQQRVGGVSYQAKSSVKAAADFHKQQLLAAKFKELPGAYVSEQTVSATYQREGYSLSLTVSDAGAPGMVFISLTNHGNVPLDKIPIPKGSKPLYSGPASSIHIAPDSVEKTTTDLQGILTKAGWVPYGGGGEVHLFRNRGILLTAMVSAAPAQMGKTTISLGTSLVSVEIPAPEKSETLQYSDSNTQLFFDTPLSEEEVVKFYKETLGKTGWEATTENLIKDGFEKFMIFRNPQKDLLNIQVREVDGKQRLLIKHQTAAEVAEEERLYKEALAKEEQEKKEREKKEQEAKKKKKN